VSYYIKFVRIFVPFERSLARRATRTAFARDVSTETKISKIPRPIVKNQFFLHKSSKYFWNICASLGISSEGSAISTTSERSPE
jgi:hypothetical protein